MDVHATVARVLDQIYRTPKTKFGKRAVEAMIRKEFGFTFLRCGYCREFKPRSEFYRDPSRTRGRHGYCVTCELRKKRWSGGGR